MDQVQHWATVMDDNVRNLGDDHSETISARGQLAFWLAQEGRYFEALVHGRVVLAHLHDVAGEYAHDSLVTRHNLACWLAETGGIPEAVDELRFIEARLMRTSGIKHPSTLSTGMALAYWLAQAGQTSDALTKWRFLLPDLLKVLGPDHPDTLTTRHNYAYWRAQAGEAAAAIEEFQHLLNDRQRILGASHPHTLVTADCLAYQFAQTGQFQEAIKLYGWLQARQAETLGPDHPDTVTSRNEMAFWTAKADKVARVAEEFQYSLEERPRVLSADHPDTLISRHEVGIWRTQSFQLYSNQNIPIGGALVACEVCDRENDTGNRVCEWCESFLPTVPHLGCSDAVLALSCISPSSLYAAAAFVTKNNRVYSLVDGKSVYCGQVLGVTPQEALAYFVKIYEEIENQICQLEQRVEKGDTWSNISSSVSFLLTYFADYRMAGDWGGLKRRLGALKPRIIELDEMRRKKSEMARIDSHAERLELVKEAESIAEQNPSATHWKSSSARMAELFSLWKKHQTSGVPLRRHEEEELWKRFSSARKQFEKQRRTFFAELNKRNAEARKIKESLIVEAEALQGSMEWQDTAKKYHDLMARWKSAPRASAKEEERLWKKFKAPQDTFFSARRLAGKNVHDYH